MNNWQHTAFKLVLAFGMATASAGIAAQNRAPKPSPQEAAMIAHMAVRGVTSFAMLNEKKGHLLLVKDSQVQSALPAISGRDAGDKLEAGKFVTPAGIFPLHPHDELAHPQSSIAYHDVPDTDISYTLHRVVKGRETRLASGKPALMRMSDGCINLFPHDYDVLGQFVLASKQAIQNASGQPEAAASWLVVLPESPKPDDTARQFRFSDYTKK